MIIKNFDLYLKKEPLPLKKSLDFLDENGLGHYKVLSKEKISNAEIVKALGTEDYIQWVLEDTSIEADSRLRYCSLFITYYELPDRVPHVPDECYVGVGYQRIDTDNLIFAVNVDGLDSKIPGRYVVFGDSGSYLQDSKKFAVSYFFKLNGRYAGSRNAARLILNENIRGKHSYFSKVEWKFYNNEFGQTVYPDKEEAILASGGLLDVILPILEQHHWPDWKSD